MQQCRLRSPFAAKYLQIDRSKPTSGPFGGYAYNFIDSPDDSCVFDISQPDKQFALNPSTIPDFLGADGTQFTVDIKKQVYTVKNRGPYESWTIEYSADRQYLLAYIKNYQLPFTSIQFVVELI